MILNEYINNIINITYIDDDTIIDDISNIKFDFYKDKYSSTTSIRLLINNKPIQTKKFKIKYKCLTCKNIHDILLKKFLLKNNKYCKNCKESDIIKRNNQSLRFENKEKWLENKQIKDVKKSYDNMPNIYKIKYGKTHLNISEFNNIKHNINNVDGILFIPDNWLYIYAHPINNQFKFAPKLFNITSNKYYNFNNIKFKCECCDNIFNKNKSLKGKIKILCPTCTYTNKTFKIRHTTNINNEKILYQSKLELQFIEECNKKHIIINNGTHIDYFFNNKRCVYRIDFILPEYNQLIEIKDNHIWHLNQLKNGKWDAKMLATNEYIKKHNLYYDILFPPDIFTFINKIKKP